MASIAQAYVEILPSARGMGRALQGEMGGMERSLGEGTRRGFMSGFSNLAGPLAAVIGGLGIGSMISDSITAASDLSETRSAVATVFGDAGAAVQSFASTAATELGQTEQQALEAARTFGIFGQAAGLSGADLSTFSTDLVGLAGDFASFNNVEPEVAIQAIGAGLRGESEPLRQFGILLDDAALKARAMEMGIYDGNGALSQQQRVLAAQAEVFAQAGVQQGDFQRTSDGLANQQRILSASWENLSASIGSVFLPIATTVVSFLNTTVMPAITAFAGGLSGAFSGGVDTSPVLSAFASIGDALSPLVSAFAPLIPQVIEFAAAFSPLSLIFQAIAPVLPQIGEMLAMLANTIGGALGQALQIVVPILTQLAGILVGTLTQAFTMILPVITELVSMLGPILGTVLQALMPVLQMVGSLFSTLVPILMPLITAVLSLLSPILSLIAPLVQLVGAILPPLINLFMAIVQPILQLATTLLSALMPAITFIIDVISTLITWIAQAVSWFVDLVTGAGTASSDLQAIFEGIPQFIADIFSGIGSWLVDSGRALIQGFIDGINGMFGFVEDAVGGIMDFVGGFFPNSPAKHGPLSGSGWRAITRSGGAIEDAFAAGFTGRIDDVLTSGVQVPRVPMSAEVAGYAAQAGSGVNVTINPKTPLDEFLVARVAADEVAYALRGV